MRDGALHGLSQVKGGGEGNYGSISADVRRINEILKAKKEIEGDNGEANNLFDDVGNLIMGDRKKEDSLE
jgi:hypothetical protein